MAEELPLYRGSVVHTTLHISNHRILHAAHSTIDGSGNHIQGTHLTVIGDNNVIKGHHNQVSGSRNHAVGNHCMMNGKHNSAEGSHCTVVVDEREDIPSTQKAVAARRVQRRAVPYSTTFAIGMAIGPGSQTHTTGALYDGVCVERQGVAYKLQRIVKGHRARLTAADGSLHIEVGPGEKKKDTLADGAPAELELTSDDRVVMTMGPLASVFGKVRNTHNWASLPEA